jgi:AraC-like DNA-binding protein
MKERVGAHALSPAPREVAEFICLRSPGGNIRPRMHTRMAIVGIRPGSAIRVESRRTIVVENDCLLIVPPLHLYGLQALHSSDFSVVTVLVEMPELTDAVVNKLPALLSVPNLHEAWIAFVDADEQTGPRIERALALRSLIEGWIAQSTPLPAAHATGWAAPLRPLRDYMRTHLNEAIPTTTLVEISGLTASHCIRAFGRQFGFPPHAYHVQLRLAAACELLAQGERVATVAYDCGFADQSHLSRKFKDAYGLAPAAWAVSVNKTVMNTSGAGRVDVQPRACQQLSREAVPV